MYVCVVVCVVVCVCVCVCVCVVNKLGVGLARCNRCARNECIGVSLYDRRGL